MASEAGVLLIIFAGWPLGGSGLAGGCVGGDGWSAVITLRPRTMGRWSLVLPEWPPAQVLGPRSILRMKWSWSIVYHILILP